MSLALQSSSTCHPPRLSSASVDPSSNLHVLVVDDDWFTRQALTTMLSESICKYVVTVVDSGHLAMKMLSAQNCSIDLVLADVLMPEMSGLELLREIRQSRKLAEIPVVLMSGIEARDKISQGLALGADAFLLKPIRMEELKVLWQHVVHRRRESTKNQKMAKLAEENEILRKELRNLQRNVVQQSIFSVRTIAAQRQMGLALQERNPFQTIPGNMLNFEPDKDKLWIWRTILLREKKLQIEPLSSQDFFEHEQASNNCPLCCRKIIENHLIQCAERFVASFRLKQVQIRLRKIKEFLRSKTETSDMQIQNSTKMVHEIQGYSENSILDSLLEGLDAQEYDPEYISKADSENLCSIAEKIESTSSLEILENLRSQLDKQVDPSPLSSDICSIILSQLHFSLVEKSLIFSENSETSLNVHEQILDSEKLLSQFKVISPISCGGYSHVYLCSRSTFSKDLYAVKVISRRNKFDSGENQDCREIDKSFLSERDTLLIGGRDCPYIIDLFFTCSSPNYHFMILEHAPGGDLFCILQRMGSLEESLAKFYAAELLIAIEFLHSRGIVHRDM